jgi:hypothetical protein
MAKATFPETTGYESSQPADAGSLTEANFRNFLSALFQGDFAPLRPRAQSTPDMTIHVNPAYLNSFTAQVWGTGNSPFTYAGGNTSSFTAPSANPRIDIVYLTSAGALAVVTGAEAASPVPLWASVPKDGIPICLIYHKTTETTIVNYEDKDSNSTQGYIYQDIRPFLNLGGGASLSDMYTAQDNIALLAFRLAIQSSLSVQKFEDLIVDEYEDETGVDTGNSDATYDSTNDLYTPPSGDQTGSGSALSGGDGSGTGDSMTTEQDMAEFFSNTGSTDYGVGQTFTPASSYAISGFKFKVSENGSPDMVVKGRLYATSGGLPTGSPLAETANINAEDFSDYSTYAYYTFTFTTPYTLLASTMYAIVIERISGTPSGSNNCFIKRSSGSELANGRFIGQNSSSVWANFATDCDLVFEALVSLDKENAFDDDTDTYWASSQTSGSVSGAAYIGYDFGSGVTKALTGFTIKQHAADQAINSVKVQRSDNGSDWTDVETVSITADTSLQTKTFTNTTAARYWRLIANAETTSGAWQIEEVGLTMSSNMDLRSAAFTAEAAPTEGRIVIFEEDVDSVTINTDLLAYISRDGGTTYTQVTLVDEGDYETGKRILAGSVSISSQPSGTSMKYKLVSANLKNLKIHGTGLFWKS